MKYKVTREAYWTLLINETAAIYQSNAAISVQEAEKQARRSLLRAVRIEDGEIPYGIASMMCHFYPQQLVQLVLPLECCRQCGQAAEEYRDGFCPKCSREILINIMAHMGR